MNFKVQQILHHYEQAEQRIAQWRPHFQDCADFICPRKANINVTRSPGHMIGERMFDSTANHANVVLAASMKGALTSESNLWFGLRARGLEYDTEHEIAVWFESCAKTMFDSYRESNFYSEINETYEDLGGLGIGAIFMDEKVPAHSKFGGMKFKSLQPGTFAFDENEEGYVDSIFCVYPLSYRAAADAFGEQTLHPSQRAKLTSNPYDIGKYLHAVMPRQVMYVHPMVKNVLPNKMPFASYWIDLENGHPLKEGGYREFPAMVPRWAKSSGEHVGRGPGSTALPTIKTLNKLIELELRALAKMIDPPVKVRDEGVIGAVRLTPGGLTHVRDMESVQTLEIGGRFDVSGSNKEEMRAMIRRMFFADQLQLQEGPQMTAYEVQVRYELMQRILGPTLGRLNVELLNPLTERAFWMHFRRGMFKPMPKALKEVIKQMGMELDIEYEGPLARAQRLQEGVAMQRYFQIVLPLSESKPEILDNIDMDFVARYHQVSTGAPKQLLVDPKEVKRIRQLRAQADAEKRQQENMLALAKAAQGAAPALKALGEGAKQGILPAPGAAVSTERIGGQSAA
jgi:hypothetical protein